MSILKDVPLPVRRKVARELFTMGLTVGEIADIFDISETATSNDFKVLGGYDIFPIQKQPLTYRRAISFANALRRYARMHLSEKETDQKRGIVEETLYEVLTIFLDVSYLEGVAQGTLRPLRVWKQATEVAELYGYQRLMSALHQDSDGGPIDALDGEKLLDKYFRYIARSKGRTPSSRNNFDSAFWSWTAKHFGLYARPPLTESHILIINSVIDGHLQDSQKSILRLYFSLGCVFKGTLVLTGATPWKLGECGKLFGITEQRAGQHLKSALQTLRRHLSYMLK